jgi:hypothetical protein
LAAELSISDEEAAADARKYFDAAEVSLLGLSNLGIALIDNATGSTLGVGFFGLVCYVTATITCTS